MGALDNVLINLSDARKLGLRFLGRHLGASPIYIKGYGPLYFRQGGHSDLEVVRQTFKNDQYRIFNPTFQAIIRDQYQTILAGGETPIIIDAGANIGASSRWFKAEYPLAHVIAVEPDPNNFGVLKRNCWDLEPIEAAIGSASGRAQMKLGRRGWGTRTLRDVEGIVPVITIPEITERANSRLFIVKIDIEGFENDLFADNLSWLDDVFVVYIEPHDWMLARQHSSKTFQAAFGARNFELLINGENLIYVRLE